MQKLATLLLLIGASCAAKIPLNKRPLTKDILEKQRVAYENMGKGFLDNADGSELPLKDYMNT